MLGRPRQRSNVPIFVLLVVTVLIVTVGLALQQPVGQGPLSFITTPIQQAFSSVGRFINGLFSTASTLQLTQRVQELQAERDTLAIENVRLREFQAENVEYRRLLNFARENPTLAVVGADVIGIGNGACRDQPRTGPSAGICAQVIANDTVPYVRYITLNVGQRDGIRVGMPVVSGAFALVGRVAEVSDASCQVQLITDPGSFINVQLVGSRATGTVSGSDDGTLRLQNVLQTEVVSPTDIIVTSGLGGNVPQLLTIGQVEEVLSKDSDVLKEARIRPAIDFNRLEVVLVVTSPTSTTISNPTIFTPTIFLAPTVALSTELAITATSSLTPTEGLAAEPIAPAETPVIIDIVPPTPVP
jgi:rod shape-determining protein MreC